LAALYRRWGGGTAAFFAYTHGSHDLCHGLLPALLPLIKIGLGITYLQSGLLLSAYTITAGISQLPGGWLGDRLSRQTVVAMGLGGVGLLAVGIGFSSSYYPLLVLLVIMGLFAGLYHPSAVSMVSGCYEEKRRGKAIAIHNVGGSIGFALGPIVGGVIAEALSWHYGYIILGIITVIAAPLVVRKFRRQEPVCPVAAAANESGATVRRISLGSVLIGVAPVVILVILCQFVAGSAMAFVPLYLVDKHGIAAAYATMLVGAIRGGGIAGSLLGGWLSDRWGRNNAVVLALVATGPTLYLLTSLPFNAGLIMVFIVFGLFMYMRQATIQALLMDRTPPYLRATIFGFYFGLGMEGQSLLQPVAGHFMDVFGIIDVFHIMAIVSVALSVVSLVLLRKK